ncbi:hypothetical protein CMT52_07685 [Elizabethkingia anophelis]|nr:hypothetical protein [Elizabethkingia anophelis]
MKRPIIINIEKLVDKIEINTSNSNDLKKATGEIEKILLQAVNSAILQVDEPEATKDVNSGKARPEEMAYKVQASRSEKIKDNFNTLRYSPESGSLWTSKPHKSKYTPQPSVENNQQPPSKERAYMDIFPEMLALAREQRANDPDWEEKVRLHRLSIQEYLYQNLHKLFQV